MLTKHVLSVIWYFDLGLVIHVENFWPKVYLNLLAHFSVSTELVTVKDASFGCDFFFCGEEEGTSGTNFVHADENTALLEVIANVILNCYTKAAIAQLYLVNL